MLFSAVINFLSDTFEGVAILFLVYETPCCCITLCIITILRILNLCAVCHRALAITFTRIFGHLITPKNEEYPSTGIFRLHNDLSN